MLKVIALGNILRGDDGIGPAVLKELETESWNIPVTFIDAGSDAFTVLDHLAGADPVLLIDCARMGKAPGEVMLFDLKPDTLPAVDKMVSLHGFGFAEIFRMASAIGAEPRCKLIGVEPKSIGFNSGLSPEIEKSMSKIINLVVEETKNYAQKNSDN